MPRTSALETVAAALLALAGLAPAAGAAVSGTVVNATTGRPAARVTLTLSSFQGGMTAVDEVVSGPDGSFAFAKDLPEVGPQQPFAGAIRAELDGVYYTEILRSGDPLDAVSITVHSTVADDIPPPDIRVVILEPQGGEMVVRESYMFRNDSDPPVTYSSENGSLRFHLPDDAGGEVEVSGEGPAGMPLRSSALPADEEGVYKVDFPIKPGENAITVSYTVPVGDGEFTLRRFYSGLETRLAVPDSVSISGDDLVTAGEFPETGASIFTVNDTDSATLRITGEGRLRAPGSATAGGGPSAEISVEPAPVARELPWILAIASLILGLGFLHLLQSRLPGGADDRRQDRRRA